MKNEFGIRMNTIGVYIFFDQFVNILITTITAARLRLKKNQIK